MQYNISKLLSHKIVLVPLLVLIVILSALITNSILKASSISGSLYIINVDILNDSGDDIVNGVEHFTLSTQSLIDGGFLSSNTLNAHIHDGSTDVVFMPGTTKIDVLSAFNSSGVDETAEVKSTTTDDVTLPATGTSVYEIALHNPGKILHVNTSTPGIGTWTITWEFYNGSTWTAFENVSDGTDGFKESGNRKVVWDLPNETSWPRVNYHSVDGFWLRARVSSFTSSTTSPLGTSIKYETGIWWTFTGDLNSGVQATYGVYLGGPAIDNFRHYFPGTRGATTLDNASIEPSSSYFMGVMGKFSIGVTGSSTASTLCIICKTGSAQIHKSASDTITYSVTGASNTTIAVTGSNVSNSLQSILVGDNGTDLVLFVSGFGIVSGTSRSALDNSNDWSLINQGTTYYMRRLGLGTSTPTHFTFYDDTTGFDTGTYSNTTAVSGSLVLTN